MKRKERDKKQENGGYADFVGRGIVNADVLVVNTTKHLDICMFIGYMEGRKSWRLWCEDGKTSKCFISQNIVFKETEYHVAMVDQLAKKASMKENAC